jgi:hypothetical protein
LYLIDRPIKWADNIVFHGPEHLPIGLNETWGFNPNFLKNFNLSGKVQQWKIRQF